MYWIHAETEWSDADDEEFVRVIAATEWVEDKEDVVMADDVYVYGKWSSHIIMFCLII